jgi:hypothetical protein
MRTQRRSETFRKGEPTSHSEAVWEVCRFLEKHGFGYYLEFKAKFDDSFVRLHKLKYYSHSYDITVWNYTNETIKMFIEVGDIGDDSRHNPGHKQQLINDGIAESYADWLHIPLVRLNKEDCYYEWWLELKLGLFLGIHNGITIL